MEEYLGFIDLIGKTIDGKFIYRFDFTTDIDAIWGEYFNIAPSGIVPNLQPDKNCLSKQAKVNFPIEMVIAKKNYCFSMQDCIDGIIPLIFSEIDENTLEYNDVPFFIHFGKEYNEVVEYLKLFNLELYDIEEVEKGDDSAIDDLISSMEDDNDENF